MTLNELNAISPIDGRYRDKVSELSIEFSESALIQYRLVVEIEYFIALCELPLPQLKEFDTEYFEKMRDWYRDLSEQDAEYIKEKEKVTNHDVKAVEYFLKEKFDNEGWTQYKEFIHFELTSQDINNTAIPLTLKHALKRNFYPEIEELLKVMNELAEEWENIPMLARTHGQPASPTKLGKEVKVFVERIEEQTEQMKNIPISAKFGGATGNFNAHQAAFPHINWPLFASRFIESAFGLKRSENTTQIEHYDNLASLFHAFSRINTILIDLCRDFWLYISMDYFKQKVSNNEVGSSAMPHKVNPIDLENAEGNLGIASALFDHMASKLPISRLQRDLTDSTVLRNIGVPLSHTLIAYKAIIKGLNKLEVNKEKIDQDLNDNWSVISEAIQTILRREGFSNPYETLKEFTRKNHHFTKETFNEFINDLDLKDEVKNEIKQLNPFNYTGV
ncbi:MAG: adenylosuccinate lyase [Flavobacteriales bacterium]